MSWWKRSADPKPKPRAAEYPSRQTLVAGELDVHIHRHDLRVGTERLPCWTYVTEGLVRAGQAEISMTVLRAGDEEPPHDPIRFFSTVHALARQGRIVRAGAVTRFGGDDGPFGRHIAYVRRIPFAGIKLPANGLIAISVTAEELEAVQTFGILRVMSRLGRQATYYPCPPWIDRARSGVSFERTARETLLSRVPRLFCPDMRIMRLGNRLNLRLSPRVRPILTQQFSSLPVESPIAFLTDLDPAADALLFWEGGEVGQTAFEAIAPVGSRGERVCGCFVVFVPVEGGEGGGMLEDGTRLLLDPSEWSALRRALCDGGAFTMEGQNGQLGFDVAWDDQWVTYKPGHPRPPREPGQRAELDGVQLLSPEPVMAANTSGLELAVFAHTAEEAIVRALSRSHLLTELWVRFTCSPGNLHVDFTARGDLEMELRSEINRALNQMVPLRVEADPIAFQLHFTVSD